MKEDTSQINSYLAELIRKRAKVEGSDLEQSAQHEQLRSQIISELRNNLGEEIKIALDLEENEVDGLIKVLQQQVPGVDDRRPRNEVSDEDVSITCANCTIKLKLTQLDARWVIDYQIVLS